MRSLIAIPIELISPELDYEADRTLMSFISDTRKENYLHALVRIEEYEELLDDDLKDFDEQLNDKRRSED